MHVGFRDGSVVENPPSSSGDMRDVGLVPGSRRPPGEGHGNPLQYCCLENPIDRGAWQATVHRVMKSQIWLKWLSMHIGTWDRYFQQVIDSRMLTRMPGVGWQPGDVTVVQRWYLHWMNLLVDTTCSHSYKEMYFCLHDIVVQSLWRQDTRLTAEYWLSNKTWLLIVNLLIRQQVNWMLNSKRHSGSKSIVLLWWLWISKRHIYA